MHQHKLFQKENLFPINDKRLLQRATGRFYSPEVISRHLAEAVIQSLQTPKKGVIKIIEPFCGDGRLVCKFLEIASKKEDFNKILWSVELWDCDANAVETAQKNVLQSALTLGAKVKTRGVAGDAFTLTPGRFGEFDVCLTNPPWELLKPDGREMSALNENDSIQYIDYLRVRDALLTSLYPVSKPLRRFSGWGLNLARCGVELSLRLISRDGVCGVVSPASLLADQMSGSLRKWIFQTFAVTDVAYYVAEARLFDKVDQPSMTLVASMKDTRRPPSLTTYNRELEKRSHAVSADEWRSINENDYILPLQSDLSLIRLQTKWNHLTKVGDLEKSGERLLWTGRELDETGHRKFLGDEGENLFLKGRMIQRYEVAEHPRSYLTADAPRVPPSASFHRVVWRDVSRPNQKRRMHAAIIPPGWVTGNSLHVAYFRDDNIERLKALLGVLNSLVFEAQVRANLATAHISLGVVRQTRIPNLMNLDITGRLARLVDKCIIGKRSFADLEVFVARLYGLSKDEFEALLATFQKLDESEISSLLSSRIWSEI